MFACVNCCKELEVPLDRLWGLGRFTPVDQEGAPPSS